MTRIDPVGVAPFVHQSNQSRVVLEAGCLARLAEEVTGLSRSRALVICSPSRRALGEQAAALLGNCAAGVFAGAVMHVPANVVDSAIEAARSSGADVLVAIGGGSPIGTAKAVALRTGLPIIALPTTYSGSEMTPIYGITDEGFKQVGRSDLVLPRVVLYDPELSLGLSYPASVTSGFNAVAHACEGLYAEGLSPLSAHAAEAGIRAIISGLQALRTSPGSLPARETCLYGAWLCGTVLGTLPMGLHHKICHTLGGTFGLPHAETHTVVLPHVLAYNAAAAPAAMAAIARAANVDKAPQGLSRIISVLGAPTSLRSLGMAEQDIDAAAHITTTNAYSNPAPIIESEIREMLRRAWAGDGPA